MFKSSFFLNIFLDVNSLRIKTEDIAVVVSQEDDSIILNCSLNTNSTGRIAEINWIKKIKGRHKKLAEFSPPGGPKPFIVEGLQDHYKNRTCLIGPNTSLSAVMIIKEPLCSDEGEYYCWIEYYYSIFYLWEHSVPIFVFNGKDIHLTDKLIFNH